MSLIAELSCTRDKYVSRKRDPDKMSPLTLGKSTFCNALTVGANDEQD